jgi:hypothetical protein
VETTQSAARLRDRLPTDDTALTRLNRIYAKPLWTTPYGRAALNLVLGPFGVARIQRTLLWALENGRLHLDQPLWRLVIVERDVRVGTLAVLDFMEHLTAFYKLWQLDDKPPSAELYLYSTEEFAVAPVLLTAELLATFNIQVIERHLDDPVEHYVNGDLHAQIEATLLFF